MILGISARIVVSVTGHWLIGYFAHNHGEMDNEVVGAAVQGHNVKWALRLRWENHGITITMLIQSQQFWVSMQTSQTQVGGRSMPQ